MRIHLVSSGRLQILAAEYRIDDALRNGNVERRVFGQLEQSAKLAQIGGDKEGAVANGEVAQAGGRLFAGFCFGVRGFEEAENGVGHRGFGVNGRR